MKPLSPEERNWRLKVESELARLERLVRSFDRPAPKQNLTQFYSEKGGAEREVYYAIAADTTLDPADVNRFITYNCSSAAALTLPSPELGMWVILENYGSSTLTVKNSTGTTMGTLTQYQMTLLRTMQTSAGVPAWPQKIIKQTSAGGLIAPDDLAVIVNGKGIVLQDNAGTPHFWRISVSSLGVLSTADLGTTYEGTLDEPEV